MSEDDSLDDDPTSEDLEVDEEPDEDADYDDPYEDLYGQNDESDFPDEEEDEDNPDWYRLPEPDDEERAAESDGGLAGSGDEDLPFGPGGDGELFRRYIPEGREQPDELLPLELTGETQGQKTTPLELDLHYDAEGFYGYVLIRRDGGDVSKADVRAVRDALTAARLMVVRAGPSHRAAANGAQYGWYLRVQRPGGGKPPADVVDRALRPFAVLPTASDTAKSEGPGSASLAAKRLATLEARLAHQNSEIASLRQINDTLRRELAVLRRAEERTRQRQAEAEDEYVVRIQRLLASLGQIRNDADGERKRAELIAQERDRVAQEAATRIEAAEEEQGEFVRTFDQEMALRKERIEQLSQELRGTQNERDQSIFERDQAIEERAALLEDLSAARDQRGRRTGGVDLEELLDALLPSVELLPGSTDVMLMELSDPAPALRLLQQLVSAGRCHGQKTVRDTPGWCEVHYSTGQKDDGRLYFARRSAGGWSVLVSRKTSRAEQSRDIDRLRRVPL